jgi:quercetin dioxygenase-like cupin family protein
MTYDEWGARISCLSKGIGRAHMSFLEVELDPGLTQNLEPWVHAGEELIHILKGVVEIHVGAERHLLKEGDSIHFRSNEPHTVRNIGDATSRVLWVALPPFHL